MNCFKINQAMALEQLETFLVGFTNFDTLSTIVCSDRANLKHSGSTGGDCLTDVVKSDLKAATMLPVGEKLLGVPLAPI